MKNMKELHRTADSQAHTCIKLCGLTRQSDILAANELLPVYIGFVFARKSRRYLSAEKALALKKILDPRVRAAGVFVDEDPMVIAGLLQNNIIDVVQLHGSEDESYIRRLRTLTDRPIFQAFRIRTKEDTGKAAASSADHILLDAGAGTGTVFDWDLIRDIQRPFFLAGGLDPDNVRNAIRTLKPYGVDVSSGIETEGIKDKTKMAAFTAAVRKEDRL